MALSKWAVVGLAFGGAGVLTYGAWSFMDTRRTDIGTDTPSQIEGRPPVAETDTMHPVAKIEGDRRATANQQLAAEKLREDPGASVVARPVITSVGAPDRTAPPPQPDMPPPPAVTKIVTETRPPTEEEMDRLAEAVAARVRASMPPPPVQQSTPPPPPPAKDPNLIKRIQAQYDQAMLLPMGGFVVRSYPRPSPPPRTTIGAGSGYAAGSAAAERMVLRAGTTVFGRLDRGFNSDDPQAPMFITIEDRLDDGTFGPLHNSKVMGTIQYSQYQSAIVFNQIVLASGYQKSIRAMAIDEKTGRTGIAANVDYHTLSRYGGLFVSSLLQGVGQVGSQLTASNSTAVYGDGYTTVSPARSINWAAAGLGMVQPLGQNLSTAFSSGFSRPPTVTAPAGMGVGLVFIDSLTLPDPVLQQVYSYGAMYNGRR